MQAEELQRLREERDAQKPVSILSLHAPDMLSLLTEIALLLP